MARSGGGGTAGGSASASITIAAIAGAAVVVGGAGAIISNNASVANQTTQVRGSAPVAVVAPAVAGQDAATASATFAWDYFAPTSGNGIATNVGTSIASASNGHALPQSTIDVASISGLTFPGNVIIEASSLATTVTCTGASGTQLTGCSGGTGNLSTGAAVNQIGSAAGPASTCGPSASRPCSGGWTPRGFDPGGAAGTTFGTSGPTWVEQAAYAGSTHASIAAYPTTPPLGLPAYGGGSLNLVAESTDFRRIARTIDTTPSSLACARGLCDSTADVNGDPMLTGTYYHSQIIIGVGSLGGFPASHLMSGLDFSFTNGEDKPNEKLQGCGLESNGKFLEDRTTQGSAEGSHWFQSPSSLTNTTWVLFVVRIKNDQSCTCDSPDDLGLTVTCANELHNKVTTWTTTATNGTIHETDTPQIAEHCIAGWKNSHRLNTLEIGGTQNYKVARVCFASTFDDARDCPIP